MLTIVAVAKVAADPTAMLPSLLRSAFDYCASPESKPRRCERALLAAACRAFVGINTATRGNERLSPKGIRRAISKCE